MQGYSDSPLYLVISSEEDAQHAPMMRTFLAPVVLLHLGGGRERKREGEKEKRGEGERERGGKLKKTRRVLLHEEGAVPGASFQARSEFGCTEQRPWAFLFLKVNIGSGIASIPGSMPLKKGCERSRPTCPSGGA
jgi:hypothetical protein